jgi:L-lactate dehydrogenase complex protein LldG
MASLVPPVHVAIVEAAQIVPDLFDIFAAYQGREQELPANLTLITGPSKTGDIELQLTTGVHGPKNWHMIVIRAER